MIIVLFVLVAVAATMQLRAASQHHPQYPGPTSSPNALPSTMLASPGIGPGLPSTQP